MKYHKKPPVITITEDDVELVADKVQDRGEDVVHKQRHKGRRSWLSWWKSMILYKGCRFLQCNNLQHNRQEDTTSTCAEGTEETIQIVVKGSDTFKVTQQMLRIDEETTQNPVRDIDQLELVMAQIPTKALYRLQASVMQEVQSRARTDATNLEVGREVA
jgi:hypothetical protein